MALQLPHRVRRSGSPVRFIGLGLCLSFTLFFFWPHPPVSLLFLVLAAILAYIRLEIAIALLPLTFPYFLFLQPLSPSGYPAFYLAELGLFICLGAALLRHVILPHERLVTREWLGSLWQQARPLLPPALLLLLGASLGLLVTPDLHSSLRAYREVIIEPLLYFLLILRYLRTRIDLARTVGAFILSILIIACIGIGQGVAHLTSFSDMVNPAKIRIVAFTYSPNNLGSLLDYAIPILLALAFLGLLRRPTDSSASRQAIWRDPLRWVCLVIMIPIVWALYWTDSRGAEVGLLVVVVFFLMIEFHSRLAILVMGGASILGIGLLWPWVIGFLNKQGHGNLSERFYIWKAALLIIRDHFLLGTGLDSFIILYRNSYLLQALDGQTSGSPGPNTPHPHNFILDFWISTGLLGAIAVLWLLGAFAAVVVRTYRRCAAVPQASLLQRLLLGVAGCMLASVVHGMVDSMYFLPDMALPFWFFMGILLVVKTIAQQEHDSLHAEKKRGEEVLAA